MKIKDPFVNQDSSVILLEKVKKWKADLENKIKQLEEKIYNFHTKHGYSSLEEMRVMDKDKKYIGAEVNELGYITDTSAIDNFFLKVDIPLDIKMGYYKIDGNKLKLDEAMRARLWGD